MKRRIEVQPDMDNVLALQQPQAYRCRVVGYLQERSLLGIEVIHDDSEFYVVIPDVHYYDGSFLWQGAALRIASRDEQFEYMLNRSAVAAPGMLFVFDTADGTVHILGGDWVGTFDDIPDRFR